MPELEIDAKNKSEFENIITAMHNNDLKFNQLKFSGCTAEDIISIAEALKVNKTITKLSLKGNYIYAKAIASALDEINTAVAELDLSCNEIGDEGAKAIAAALEVNTAVAELDLSYNDIGDEGAIAIAEALEINKAVTQLNLSHNYIGDEGAKAMAEALEVNKAITQFDLSRNHIGDEGAKAIAEALRVNKAITQLHLSDNLIGDEGSKAIANALKINTAVTKLDLSDNDFGDEGAKAIANALKVNIAVTELDLSYNEIGAEGAKAIANALEVNKVVTELDLNDNKIGAEVTKAIVAALEANKVVTERDLSVYEIGEEEDYEGYEAMATALGRNKNFLNSAQDLFLAKKELTNQQYQVLLTHMDGYDPLNREKLVGSFLSKAMVYPEAINIEIGKFLSRAELIKFQIPTQLKSIDQIAGPLLEILKLPNNFIFIQDELKNNRPSSELIDNLLIIKNDPNALEFVTNNPKTLGALMRLDKNNLDKALYGIEFLHAMKPLQILKSSENILDNNSAKTEFANPSAPNKLAMYSSTERSSSNPTFHKISHVSEEDDYSSSNFPASVKSLGFIMPKLTIEYITQPTKLDRLQIKLVQEEKPEVSNKVNFYSYGNILGGLKALDASVDVFKLIQEPTLEHLNLLVRDAALIGIMLTGTSGYLPLVNAVDIAAQFYNGEYNHAFNQAATIAGYMLLPAMLGTSLAPVYAASALVGYTGYNLASNAYSVYSNYGTAESQLKSNLAYANLESNLGLQDMAKECLVNAMKIVKEDFELHNNYESSIQQIATEYNLLGKVCELSTMDLF